MFANSKDVAEDKLFFLKHPLRVTEVFNIKKDFTLSA
jgi:hypothetical protein